jgi:hypothetical protein
VCRLRHDARRGSHLEGRRAVGIELEEQFCETAIDRLAKGAEGDRW